MVLSSSSWEIIYCFQQLPQPIPSATLIRNVSLMANFLTRCHTKLWAEHVLLITLSMFQHNVEAWTLMERRWTDKESFNTENVLLPSPGLSVQSYPSRSTGVSSAATEQRSDISACPLLTFLEALILHRGQQKTCCSRGWAIPVRLSMTGCRANCPI